MENVVVLLTSSHKLKAQIFVEVFLKFFTVTSCCNYNMAQ